eukprot:4718538-Lingulodinium_polyedra.AAC.1
MPRLYLGLGETRGMVMIAPALLQHVAEESAKEAAVMKERRDIRGSACRRAPAAAAAAPLGARLRCSAPSTSSARSSSS